MGGAEDLVADFVALAGDVDDGAFVVVGAGDFLHDFVPFRVKDAVARDNFDAGSAEMVEEVVADHGDAHGEILEFIGVGGGEGVPEVVQFAEHWSDETSHGAAACLVGFAAQAFADIVEVGTRAEKGLL